MDNNKPSIDEVTDEELGVAKSDYPSKTPDRLNAVAWRREKVLTLRAKGLTIDQIVSQLRAGNADVRISHGTVVNDLKAIREQVNKNLSQYVEEELPMENKIALTGIREIIKEAWGLADNAKDDKTRLAALSLAKEAYLTQQTLLGDVNVLEHAINWLKKAKAQLSEEEDSSDQ